MFIPFFWKQQNHQISNWKVWMCTFRSPLETPGEAAHVGQRSGCRVIWGASGMRLKGLEGLGGVRNPETEAAHTRPPVTTMTQRSSDTGLHADSSPESGVGAGNTMSCPMSNRGMDREDVMSTCRALKIEDAAVCRSWMTQRTPDSAQRGRHRTKAAWFPCQEGRGVLGREAGRESGIHGRRTRVGAGGLRSREKVPVQDEQVRRPDIHPVSDANDAVSALEIYQEGQPRVKHFTTIK